jgi:hypothetical protein
MKCRDFERLVHEQLDARAAGAPETTRALADHAAACAACGATAMRYEILRQAIAAWTQRPPVPPADFANRFPANWADLDVAPDPAVWGAIARHLPALSSLAAAAVLLLLIGAGIRYGGPRRPAPQSHEPAPAARPIDSEALSSALAEASSATWELALHASGPAARVGLEVLDAPALAQSKRPLATPVDGGPDADAAAEVLQDVGARVNDEVGPLSSTARHAFGFLIGDSGG